MSCSMLNLLLSAYTTTRPNSAVINKQARVGWVWLHSTHPTLETRLNRARRQVSGGLGAFRLGDSHRKQPRDPQEQKIEREEDDQAGMAAKRALDDKPDEIGSKIARNHEDEVVDDELHDALPTISVAAASSLAQRNRHVGLR